MMLTSGTILQNRYRLQQQLNDNPARQTWLAQDLESQDHQVVVKLLALGGAVQWDDLKLFERETQILKQLNHPRIPKYRDYFSLDDRTLWFGLVQEYIPGASLKQQVEKGKSFTQEQIHQIAEDVLEILQFLHQLNPPVLHRDIKPSNLIWGEDDRIYLIDFGAVQARPSAAGKTFTVVGTYGYTPMEQFGGQAVPASDLYALGATLIHLLTGMSPSELPQQDLRIQFRERLSSSIEPKLVNWIEKLTEPSLEKRFQYAQEALEALKAQPTSVPSHQLLETAVRLEKSPERLLIEIPSPFEIKFLRPLRKLLKQGAVILQQVFARLLERFQVLEKHKQRRILVGGAIALTGILLIDFFGLVSLTGFFGQIVLFVISLLFPLLPLALAASIVMWVVLSNSGVDYFETIRLCFDARNFEILRQSSRGKQREGGEVAQIKEIYLAVFRDALGKNRQSIAISTSSQQRRLFFASSSQPYIFGDQLSEEELRWLVQEMQDWLENQSTGK